MDTLESTKRCPQCGLTKNRSDFNHHRYHADGVKSECRNCQSLRAARYNEKRRNAGMTWGEFLPNRARHQKRYKAGHPLNKRLDLARWRARKRGATVLTLTVEEWRKRLREYKESCAFCGEHTYLTMEHVVAIADGGEHTYENVVPCCFACNLKRNGARTKKT